MTPNQIAELRELLPPIARGDSVQIHRESYERAKELTLRLLDERKILLAACRAADDALGNASEGGRFYAAAVALVQAAIAKADKP